MESLMSQIVKEMMEKYNKYIQTKMEFMSSGEILCVHQTLRDVMREDSLIYDTTSHVLSKAGTCTEEVTKTQYTKL